MALTVCYALLGSLLFSLTLIPALATYLFRARTNVRRHRALEAITAWYGRPSIGPLTTPRGPSPLPACSSGALPWLSRDELFPADGGSSGSGQPPGRHPVEKSAEMARQIRLLSGVARGPPGGFQTGENDSGPTRSTDRNELLVDLRPYDTWRAGRTKAALVEELAGGSPPISGWRSTSQPIIDTATEIVTGSSADLAVISDQTFGSCALGPADLDVLRRVPGAADTSIEQEANQAQLSIVIDRLRVAIRDQRAMQDHRPGAGRLADHRRVRRRPALTWSPASRPRRQPGRYRRAPIPTRDGARPGPFLADIRRRTARASSPDARTSARSRCARTSGAATRVFVALAQARLADAVKLPPGYSVDWGGSSRTSRARQRLTSSCRSRSAHLHPPLPCSGLPLTRAPSRHGAAVARRRGGRAVSPRHEPQRLGGGGVHLASFGVAVMSCVLYIRR